MRALVFVTVSALVALAAACGTPVCDPIAPTAFSACRASDAGVIAPDAGFTLVVSTNTSQDATCTVNVDPDAGLVSLSFAFGPSTTCGASGAAAARALTQSRCAIPPLAAGTWTVNTNPPTVLHVPDDGGVSTCP
ncbi:MAG: hypothetical protein U0228_12525 [Myxococcaceae bacterium]